jgi:hypothetical protein
MGIGCGFGAGPLGFGILRWLDDCIGSGGLFGLATTGTRGALEVSRLASGAWILSVALCLCLGTVRAGDGGSPRSFGEHDVG